ncbi:unnamed protein product [Amoebophrya sp. A25]|nr:unnamed protein product [Amoebophrya sp. A25]|eukprot:GSA25T00017674001.1
MKIDRAKRASKDLRRYRMVFGVTEPYRVLLDPTLIHVALESKIHIKEQLSKLLGSWKVTPMVTSCAIKELEQLVEKVGGQYKGALKIAKTFYHLKCGHVDQSCASAGREVQEGQVDKNKKQNRNVEGQGAVVDASASRKDDETGESKREDEDGEDEPKLSRQARKRRRKTQAKQAEQAKNKSFSACECISNLFRMCPKDADGANLQEITSTSSCCSSVEDATSRGDGVTAERNFRSWLVASQDENLKKSLRQIPGIPILTLHGQVPGLETLSEASKRYLSTCNTDRVENCLSEWDAKHMPVLQREKRLREAELEARKGKKKRMRGHRPNPLSCLKKKKKSATAVHKKVRKADGDGTAGDEVKKKKTRSRSKNKVGGNQTNTGPEPGE